MYKQYLVIYNAYLAYSLTKHIFEKYKLFMSN